MESCEKLIAPALNGKSFPDDPIAPWAQITDCYLKDCLELKQYKKIANFLSGWGFSADEQKALLEIAVKAYLNSKMMKKALKWIEDVSVIFGASAVSHLASNSEFAALRKSKTFRKLTGPKAELHFFKQAFKEAKRMWKNELYDNYKDAIEDADRIYADSKKFGKANTIAAKKHLDNVVKGVKKIIKESPDLKSYLEDVLESVKI